MKPNWYIAIDIFAEASGRHLTYQRNVAEKRVKITKFIVYTVMQNQRPDRPGVYIYISMIKILYETIC